jgi:KipI family sensor histidine kinase inhibitor
MAGVRHSGDRALLCSFDGDLEQANATALALHRLLLGEAHAEVEDLIPGARSLCIVLRRGAEPSADLMRSLTSAGGANRNPRQGDAHEIGVTYDGDDLEEVARLHGISSDDVIRLHSSAIYRVGFVGFSPGFAYLIGLPRVLHTPRLGTPRTRVPAGAVGIGGEFTGVYPRATPGGWLLIGRTDLPMFDAHRDPPSLLAPGDRVRFVAR